MGYFLSIYGYLYIKYHVMINENTIKRIVQEEITKADEKRIREIIADSVSELFKNLWQKKTFWQNEIKNK